jgi:aminoglycoside 6'-N-acetyltransferase I
MAPNSLLSGCAPAGSFDAVSLEPTIRIAQQADLVAWSLLRSELWPDCSAERHKLEIAQLVDSHGIVALAEVNGEIVGFAEASIRDDHVEGTSITPVPYLEGWFVSKDFRRIGIGKALLAFIEAWALKQGFRELASDAEVDNLPAIQTHRRRGFEETGRTVHFVKRLGEDSASSGAGANTKDS